MTKLLDGLRVLVVEDDCLAASEMRDVVEELGGVALGPVARLEQALRLVQSDPPDAAILDVRLDGDDSLPVADALVALGTPVIFATGYDADSLPERFAETPRVAKPFSRVSIERTLRKALSVS